MSPIITKEDKNGHKVYRLLGECSFSQKDDFSFITRASSVVAHKSRDFSQIRVVIYHSFIYCLSYLIRSDYISENGKNFVKNSNPFHSPEPKIYKFLPCIFTSTLDKILITYCKRRGARKF